MPSRLHRQHSASGAGKTAEGSAPADIWNGHLDDKQLDNALGDMEA